MEPKKVSTGAVGAIRALAIIAALFWLMSVVTLSGMSHSDAAGIGLATGFAAVELVDTFWAHACGSSAPLGVGIPILSNAAALGFNSGYGRIAKARGRLNMLVFGQVTRRWLKIPQIIDIRSS